MMKKYWVHFNEWLMIAVLGSFTLGIIGAVKLGGWLQWASWILSVVVVLFVILQLSLSIHYEGGE